MSSLMNALLEELKVLIIQLVKDSVKAALAEQAGQPRDPERVSVKQASEITGYSKNSLYQMHSRSQIPGAHKVGGKLMFDTETLRQWVNSGGNAA